MKIEVWSDYACPFCYIGKRQLELAIEALKLEGEVEVAFHAFELDPNAPKRYEGTIEELLAKKYGMSVEQAKAGNQRIIKMAEGVGLHYDFDAIKPSNTFDAHRLAQFAKTKGLEKAFSEAVLKAYFTEGQWLAGHETLKAIGRSVGLVDEAMDAVLTSDLYAAEVRADEAQAREYGINSVPYFVVENQYAVAGAQSVEGFKAMLQELKPAHTL